MRFINIAQAGPMADSQPISSIATSIANFVTGVIAVMAILVIVVAGIMYLTSGGDESRVANSKKALIAGVVGLIIAIIAFVVIKTIAGIV